EMRLATTEVYEVATFYHHFDVIKEDETPPPQITVRVCDSVSCAIAGADSLSDELKARIGKDVRVIHAPCVGRCQHAPVAVVGQNPIDEATPEKVVEAVKAGSVTPEITDYVDYDEYLKLGGYRVLKDCHEGVRQPAQVIEALSHAGLRGLGGAGMATGRKWNIMLKTDPNGRILAMNADEGEPGTFKDRYFMESDPHRILEGMLIAAACLNLADLYLYVRDEYAGVREIYRRELEKLAAHPPFGLKLPPIHLRRGAGAYICGEQSAMIESLEGKRGEPRLRPPFLTDVGLFGRPTLEHNVETLYWVRDIVEKGPEWFSSYGRHDRKGLRSFSVSGRVKKPGVHLAPAGITMVELIDEYCGGMLDGHTFAAYLPGGASGGILPARLGNIPLDFDTLQPYGCFIGSAAVMVLSDKDDVVEVARNVMRFFADESCGQCTPCRVGTAKALRLMEAPRWDAALLEELSEAMVEASICGLGQAAPNPIRCVIKYFSEEISK
ncbi:MAG: NAD(P)H-dependent oxidoreductase subunit E, partial [Pseudomonadota bacterium]|nr:NAD(P)H-dependent oxidoreductase subunit E [Pseudomonadota bacterium]